MNTRNQRGTMIPFILGIFGLVCLLTGAGIALFGTVRLLDMWHRENFSLLSNSIASLFWANLPQPIIFKVYIFNVTNPDEIITGAKPNLSEVGPYVYGQSISREELKIPQKGILSFKFRSDISFTPEKKSPKDTDEITVLNVPLMEAYLVAEEAVPSLLGMVDFFRRKAYPKGSGIFIRTSVKNFLFDGLRINCTSKNYQVAVVCKAMQWYRLRGFRMGKKSLKFSFFYHKNGTFFKTYQVLNGYANPRNAGRLLTINNSTTLNSWNKDYCNMINGTDGLRFPIAINKSEKLYIFEKEMCRSIHLEFEEIVARNGTKLYKYINTESLLASKENNPANECFCRRQIGEPKYDEESEANKNSKPLICLKNGALSIQPCGAGLLIVSFPHFYLGDKSYIDYSGLAPKKEIHETYAKIEPVTGTLIEGFKRFQFNMEFRKINEVNITANLISGLFPILWFEEGLNLSDDFFQKVQYKLFEKVVIENGAFYLMAVGVIIMIFSLIFHITLRKILCCCEEKKLLSV